MVDAGAHRGEFSAILRRDYGCRCVLIEANPELSNHLKGLSIGTVINAALGSKDGRAILHVQENLEGSSIVAGGGVTSKSTVEVETISLQSVLSRTGFDHIDLLKLDIEGAEFELIEATPDKIWAGVSQITVEFHDFVPRFSHQRLFQKARTRLQALAFVATVMSFRTHGDVLFLNCDRVKLTSGERMRLRYLARLESRLAPYLPASL
ncbi:MAG: FkbM family methyltransferase [Chthoniobacterales bacterium]|nr:FkbM family methyltransferase [Chthoniobacterales bacterium]